MLPSHRHHNGARRAHTAGKFLWVGDEKFFVRGVTYGAFAPNGEGDQFPDPGQAARDLASMHAAGINTLLTYTLPPVWLLDLAIEHDLRVIINIPWMGHVCFLEDARTRRAIRREVKQAVAACGGHPAGLLYAVAKEVPPPIVRWYGKRKIESFLRSLYDVAKDEDPEGLVTYTNFPTTEYLELPFLDVCTFNVYLHRRPDFCNYLSRLQHLAGDLPLVLTELGICSFRHGQTTQAEFLDWQLEETFDHGLAGAVIFSWTDPFFQDGQWIDEWGFGLVDAERRPKPSYAAVRRRFSAGTPFPPSRHWPTVSVVVALHNAAKTIGECLASLSRLRYPAYEVVVVNDGSTDESASIITRYPFRVIESPNQGVSAARNRGLQAARGDIVAYIDSDAVADPDWLSYLVTTFHESDVAGTGGPNLVPRDDPWIAKCVYRSPGGPTHVMLDDQAAEHLPGCNMAFWKWALEEIGGFDPIFTAAGDDVDVCWRLLERGYRLGFSPSAVVWHHRRASIRAYWRQQVGYGKSEALLERRHPRKFNPWGHAYWEGRIYAPYPVFRLLGEPVIYQGLWGSAAFQSLYHRGSGGAWSYLPRALEFHVALTVLAIGAIWFPWMLALVAVGVGYLALYCGACARAANLNGLLASDVPRRSPRRLGWRAVIAWLHALEPIARDWGRLQGGLTPWRRIRFAHHGRFVTRWWERLHPFRRVARWSYPGGTGLQKVDFLQRLTDRLKTARCAVAWNSVFEGWDLRVRRGVLGEAEVRLVVEHHGGPRRVARFAATIRPRAAVVWVLAAIAVVGGILAALGSMVPVVPLLLLFVVLWIAPILEGNRLERGLHETTDAVYRLLESGESDPE